MSTVRSKDHAHGKQKPPRTAKTRNREGARHESPPPKKNSRVRKAPGKEPRTKKTVKLAPTGIRKKWGLEIIEQPEAPAHERFKIIRADITGRRSVVATARTEGEAINRAKLYRARQAASIGVAVGTIAIKLYLGRSPRKASKSHNLPFRWWSYFHTSPRASHDRVREAYYMKSRSAHTQDQKHILNAMWEEFLASRSRK